MNSLTTRILGLFCASLTILFFSACDSSGSGEGDVTVSGRVTNDAGYGKTLADIEGATVTAVTVAADGDTDALDAEATTNAEGRYTIDLEDAADVVVVMAEKDQFESSVLVYTAGRSTVNAIPMTIESDAEANVYVEAKQDDDAGAVTVADVALYVTQEVAAELQSETTTVEEIAAAVRAAARAEMAYIEEEEGEDAAEDVQEEEREAYLQLQAEASVSAGASGEAFTDFEQALANAYEEADVSAETYARARIASQSAVTRLSSGASAAARFAMRKRAEVIAAWAQANAIEAAFEAEGAGNARLSALQQARATLVASLRAATTADAIADAYAAYESAVVSELAAEMDVTVEAIASAESGLASIKNLLDIGLGTATSASTIVELYSEFFTAARASVEGEFSGNDGADLAATVVTLLSVR